MQTGNVSTYSYSGLPEALKNAIDDFLLLNLNQRLNGQISLERIQKPVNLTIHVGDSGRILTESSVTALFFIPLIFAMVFMMSSNVTSGFLMNGVVEEKTNRIMEILITSVTPGQLLLGKIIGLGVLGLTQMVVWGIAGGVLLQVGQRFPFLAGVTFPSDLVIIFVVYFILSYFLLASLMAGLGAVAGSEQESRQYAGIISLIWVIPFFFIASFITEPNGTLPIVLTFIPFTAPMTALLRLGFSAVPAWQIVVSLVILLLTTILVVWGSGRVFRWALLLYGKRITPREVWSAIRRPSGTATVATAHTAEEGAV
jgi:ABC-2 type transport system permease protein